MARFWRSFLQPGWLRNALTDLIIVCQGLPLQGYYLKIEKGNKGDIGKKLKILEKNIKQKIINKIKQPQPQPRKRKIFEDDDLEAVGKTLWSALTSGATVSFTSVLVTFNG